MFSVGRYDPNAFNGNANKDIVKPPNSASTQIVELQDEKDERKRKLSQNEHDEVQQNDDGTIGDDDDDKDTNLLSRVIKKQKSDIEDSNSSSCPSSDSDDDSSSSAPSSDEEEEEKEVEPALKVIAHEEKQTLVNKMNEISNERIDDFDDNDFDDNKMNEQSTEITRALHMSTIDIEDAAKIWNLAPFLVQNLKKDDYDSFFPIQALVIPDVIASERHAHIRSRDVCVSAPTGSGKTLSFVLPVLNSLADRKIRRLRALIVLPSRDLAKQVYDVFERYAQGSDLSIGLAIGQANFETEQRNLIIGPKSNSYNHQHSISGYFKRFQHALHPFSIQNALQAFDDISKPVNDPATGCIWAQSNLKQIPGLCATPRGGTSSIDVLVCTPGRLMDHLEKTPGFTLQHLRFLVIDEADRLVNQSYQNWIQRVVAAASVGSDNIRADLSKQMGCNQFEESKILDPVTWRKDEGNKNRFISGSLDLNDFMDTSVCRPVQLRKLLFSATMTKDPRKLASLGLINPKLFDAHHLSVNRQNKHSASKSSASISSYSLPEGLSESMVECTAEQKPLVLLACLLEQGLLDKTNNWKNGIVVVFTSSVDSTHRLARLLQLLWSMAKYGKSTCVVEFSSALTQKQRAKLMKRCNKVENGPESRIHVIVCSDGMSRGMDLSSVSAVVNYDVPSFAKTYVHRCGRTARAGRDGRAITILKGGQVSKFLAMRQLIDKPENVSKGGIRKDLVKEAIPVYQKCVQYLKNVMDAELNNELSPVAPLDKDYIQMV